MTALDRIGSGAHDEVPTDKEICEWVVNTCLTWGCQLSTAYMAAGLFIKGTKERPHTVDGTADG